MKAPGKIIIVGGGMIGTAVGNVLAGKAGLEVKLFTVEPEVADSISRYGVNQKYFPNIKLHAALGTSTDIQILDGAGVVFLAIPSVHTVDFIKENGSFLSEETIIINLAKGFGKDNKTITTCLEEFQPGKICSLKGPTFAREIVSGVPTAFTFAAKEESLFSVIYDLFKDTNVYLDFTTDVTGTEVLSILKNIYAIAIGIVDAHFDSPNLRFMFLTRAFNEMRGIMLEMGGREETMFHYCGFGDFSLTALNDLSRNRTLGLLIGKGFFIENISDKVVLEGKIAVNEIVRHLNEGQGGKENYPIIRELYKVFNQDYNLSVFVNQLLHKLDS